MAGNLITPSETQKRAPSTRWMSPQFVKPRSVADDQTASHSAQIRDRGSSASQPGRRRFSQSIFQHRRRAASGPVRFQIGRRRVGTAASLQNSCLEGSIPSRPAILLILIIHTSPFIPDPQDHPGAHVPKWRHCLASSVWRVRFPWLPPISNQSCFSKHKTNHDWSSSDDRSQKIWRPGVTRCACRKAGKGTATLSVPPRTARGQPGRPSPVSFVGSISCGTMLEDGRRSPHDGKCSVRERA